MQALVILNFETEMTLKSTLTSTENTKPAPGARAGAHREWDVAPATRLRARCILGAAVLAALRGRGGAGLIVVVVRLPPELRKSVVSGTGRMARQGSRGGAESKKMVTGVREGEGRGDAANG